MKNGSNMNLIRPEPSCSISRTKAWNRLREWVRKEVRLRMLVGWMYDWNHTAEMLSLNRRGIRMLCHCATWSWLRQESLSKLWCLIKKLGLDEVHWPCNRSVIVAGKSLNTTLITHMIDTDIQKTVVMTLVTDRSTSAFFWAPSPSETYCFDCLWYKLTEYGSRYKTEQKLIELWINIAKHSKFSLPFYAVRQEF